MISTLHCKQCLKLQQMKMHENKTKKDVKPFNIEFSKSLKMSNSFEGVKSYISTYYLKIVKKLSYCPNC
jgi:hypothetical protein